MGLFDGADPAALDGSTAELARWLDAPVLLVVNAHGTARSIAATVSGFARFEPGVTVAGVIANSCGSQRHAAWIAESLRAAGLPPLVGTLPRGALPSLPSRHLGLVAAPSGVSFDEFADAADRHLAPDAILALARSTPPVTGTDPSVAVSKTTVRLGLAEDAAFHFYYPDNLEALEAAGARLVRFSPLSDLHLPARLDGLYIGGGYPEEHAAALSANTGMLASLRDFAASGRPVYAECGGLMYLSQGIETLDRVCHGMVGLLPVWTRMLPRRKALGYVEVLLEEDSLFAAQGACLRGHEYHYSEIVDPGAEPDDWRPAYWLRRRREAFTVTEGFQRGHILASYVHLHFASHPDAARRFVRYCEESRP
jgi:cobyrinic acid a,c-diamide synthase